ncbi:MAG: flagellar biosynthesis protein FlhG [Myxococcota bacterium]|jgi:flagellar biosynthesis protein FlhG
MTTIITVASGKGGVGKSVAVTNLGLALAARGRRVILADLDVGGSNLATLYGAFEAGPDLGSFFSRDVA